MLGKYTHKYQPEKYKCGPERFIEVDMDGGALVNTACSFTGEERDELLMQFHDMKDDEKRKFFFNRETWKQPDAFKLSRS